MSEIRDKFEEIYRKGCGDDAEANRALERGKEGHYKLMQTRHAWVNFECGFIAANAKPGAVDKEKLIKDLLFCAKSCPSTKADYIISSIITKIMRGDFDIKPGGE